ncbi:MAG: NADH-quinone oxidoreductase subunit C [Acidimicrobiales bacterium]
MTAHPVVATPPTDDLAAAVAGHTRRGARLCGLFALPRGEDTALVAVVSDGGRLVTEETTLAPGEGYPALTPEVPAAAWYEREIRDLFGIEPLGHPRLDPLAFPLPAGSAAPRPGAGPGPGPGPLEPDLTPLPAHVHGEGVFTVPYGPVRSGVFESIEYLVETSGEDIPHLRTRVFYKHRGMASRGAGMTVEDGVLLAERHEGVASVAHALAFCGAVEGLAGVDVPLQAELVRVVHAELERVANHLDSMVRHAEAAGQAVALATLSHHKERVLRLRGRLCGSRFGRGVVVPGGVGGPLGLGAGDLRSALRRIEHLVDDDVRRLMATPSFVDRLRGTGVLSADDARRLAVVGPVGRASGQPEDLRANRPYSAYGRLGHHVAGGRLGGDALARQDVRIEEIGGSFHLVRRAVELLDRLGPPPCWRVPLSLAGGRAIGWAEAPQGEVLSLVEAEDGKLAQLRQRSASFHNLAAFPSAFPREVFTDFAFIEASFGLSIAGAAG